MKWRIGRFQLFQALFIRKSVSYNTYLLWKLFYSCVDFLIYVVHEIHSLNEKYMSLQHIYEYKTKNTQKQNIKWICCIRNKCKQKTNSKVLLKTWIGIGAHNTIHVLQIISTWKSVDYICAVHASYQFCIRYTCRYSILLLTLLRNGHGNDNGI